jgi:hypothetical protein
MSINDPGHIRQDADGLPVKATAYLTEDSTELRKRGIGTKFFSGVASNISLYAFAKISYN